MSSKAWKQPLMLSLSLSSKSQCANCHVLSAQISSNMRSFRPRFLSQPQILKMPAYGISLFHGGFKRVKAAFDALSVSAFKITVHQLLCAICSNIIKMGDASHYVFFASTSKFRDPLPMFSLLGILYKWEYELSMLSVCQVVFSLPLLQYTQV